MFCVGSVQGDKRVLRMFNFRYIRCYRKFWWLHQPWKTGNEYKEIPDTIFRELEGCVEILTNQNNQKTVFVAMQFSPAPLGHQLIFFPLFRVRKISQNMQSADK